MNTIQYTSNPVSGKLNPKGQKFSGAQDRFKLNKTLIANPSPIKYKLSTLDTMGKKQIYKNQGHAAIGKGNIDILDNAYHKRERS